jgi:cystathionine beta-lyase/cystathionine gamma-synthase
LAAKDAMRKGRVAMIFIETPANPTNGLVDIAMVRRGRRDDRPIQTVAANIFTDISAREAGASANARIVPIIWLPPIDPN